MEPRPSVPRPAPPQRLSDRVRGWVTWFGLGRLIAGAVSIIAVAAGAFWLLRAPPVPVEATLPYARSSSTSVAAPEAGSSSGPGASTSAPVPVEVVVHVAGAVAVPGVYRLGGAARVVDAVAAAGGMGADANHDGVNLAAPVHDGERVYVPRLGEPVVVREPPGAAPTSAAGPVNLNEASVAELDTLPGVGPATAAAIIAHRDANGPFQAVDELADVRGIGPAKLAALRDQVTV